MLILASACYSLAKTLADTWPLCTCVMISNQVMLSQTFSKTDMNPVLMRTSHVLLCYNICEPRSYKHTPERREVQLQMEERRTLLGQCSRSQCTATSATPQYCRSLPLIGVLYPNDVAVHVQGKGLRKFCNGASPVSDNKE